MDAALARRRGRTAGARRIAALCHTLGRQPTGGRGSAQARLEGLLGPELADRLVSALAGGRGVRARRV